MKLQNHTKEEPTVDLTSLIDVVFLLLIFFMVSTTFERQALLKVDLPEASEVEDQSDVPDALELVIDDEGRMFLNDQIARSLAGVTQAGRPLFLKMPYCGPKALEELVTYDPSLVVGILGGSSGTSMDAFTLLEKAKKHGGRAALFGRKINNAEDQLLMIELLRQVAEGTLRAEQAVRVYHDGLQERGIKPLRNIKDDSQITAHELTI